MKPFYTDVRYHEFRSRRSNWELSTFAISRESAIPVMVSETVAAIRRNMRIVSYVEGAARRDVPEYPEVALREVVTNALMHRDYSPEGVASQVQVNMFADRIEVISPGGLFGMVTVGNIGTYGASASRNQFLSRILESTPFPQDAPESGFVVENKGTDRVGKVGVSEAS